MKLNPMSRKLRRQFDGKFKTKVLIESLRERKTLSEICKEYDLHPNQISDWKKVISDELPSFIPLIVTSIYELKTFTL